MSLNQDQDLTAIVSLCQQGDQQAWEELLDLLTPIILAICRHAGLPADESLDVFGQVCHVLLTDICRLRSKEKVLFFAAKVTHNEIFHLRRRVRRAQVLEREFAVDQAQFTDKTPETRYVLEKRAEALLEALSKLPNREHHLIRALFLDPLEPSYAEISESLKIPVSSIGPTRARSLAKLRDILAESDFDR